MSAKVLNYDDRRERAMRYFNEAYRRQKEGDLERAESYYRRSIALYATAEGFTFLVWTYSMRGRLEEAITECKRALEIDPEFGNPYNDIGAYLIELGRLDEAVPYLRKAIVAKRYDCAFYAHYNLGRIWEMKSRFEEAASEYRRALEVNPYYLNAQHALKRLMRRIDRTGPTGAPRVES